LDSDRVSFVKFMFELKIKTYLTFASILSVGLSSVKYFKYRINYENDDQSFPISNEVDLSIIYDNKKSLESYFYFVVNCIVDLFNYVVFVCMCLSIDVFLAVKLRNVLREKISKLKSVNAQNIESKIGECEEAIHQNVKMVVLNTTIGLLFKLPMA